MDRSRRKHEALISEELYQKAQDILKSKSHVPYRVNNKITNPLAGLIRCAECGSSMVLRPKHKAKTPSNLPKYPL